MGLQYWNKAINGKKDEPSLYINRGDCLLRMFEFSLAAVDYQVRNADRQKRQRRTNSGGQRDRDGQTVTDKETETNKQRQTSSETERRPYRYGLKEVGHGGSW